MGRQMTECSWCRDRIIQKHQEDRNYFHLLSSLLNLSLSNSPLENAISFCSDCTKLVDSGVAYKKKLDEVRLVLKQRTYKLKNSRSRRKPVRTGTVINDSTVRLGEQLWKCFVPCFVQLESISVPDRNTAVEADNCRGKDVHKSTVEDGAAEQPQMNSTDNTSLTSDCPVHVQKLKFMEFEEGTFVARASSSVLASVPEKYEEPCNKFLAEADNEFPALNDVKHLIDLEDDQFSFASDTELREDSLQVAEITPLVDDTTNVDKSKVSEESRRKPGAAEVNEASEHRHGNNADSEEDADPGFGCDFDLDFLDAPPPTTNSLLGLEDTAEKEEERKRLAAFPCNECWKAFPTLNGLNVHKRCHTIRLLAKTIPCHHCDKMFSLPCFWKHHYALKHMNEKRPPTPENPMPPRPKQKRKRYKGKPRLCPECGKLLSTDNNYLMHKQTHKDEKHICDICGKILKTKLGLWKHRRFHLKSRERKVPCPLCDKMFFTKSNVTQHVRVFHDKLPWPSKIKSYTKWIPKNPEALAATGIEYKRKSEETEVTEGSN